MIDSAFNAGTGASSGSVRSLTALQNNKVLVGGSFTFWNGALVTSLVRLNEDGSVDYGFSPAAGLKQITGAWEQPDGKILVAGAFTEAGGLSRTNFVRLQADGSVDGDFTANTDNRVYSAVTLEEGRLLISGAFHQVNGVARTGVAVLHSDGSIDPFFAPESGVVGVGKSAIALPNGRFLVAGLSYDDEYGRKPTGMLRMEPTGAVDKAFELDNVSFFANTPYLLSNGNLLIDSTFNLARALANDSIDQRYTNGAGSTFAKILAVQPDERHLVAGSGVKDANGSASHLVRLFADGKIDSTFSTSLSADPTAVVVRPDGKIVVAVGNSVLALHSNNPTKPAEILWHGTEFEAVHNGPVTLKVIRQGNLSEPSSANWTATTEGALQTIPSSGSIQFLPGQSLASVTVNLTSDPSVTSSLQLTMKDPQSVALGAIPTAKLYVTNQTGLISLSSATVTISEAQGRHLASIQRSGAINRPAAVGWRITGGTDPSRDFLKTSGEAFFDTHEQSSVIFFRALDDTDFEPSRSYQLEIFSVDPDFPTISPTNTPLLVLENDLPNYPGLAADDDILLSDARAEGGALLFGNFRTINGVAQSKLALLSSVGELDRNFAPAPFDGTVNNLEALNDGRILLGGIFTNGAFTTPILRLLPNGVMDASLKPPILNGPASVAETADGSLLLAGRVADFNGNRGNTNLGAVVRLRPDGAKDLSFGSPTLPINVGVISIAPLPNGQFYLYGSFQANTNFYVTGASNITVRQGVARFNFDGSLDLSFFAQFGSTNVMQSPGSLSPPVASPSRLYAYADGRVVVGGTSSNINGRLTPDLARLTSTGELDLQFLTNVTAALGKNARVMAFDVSPQGKILVLRDRVSVPFQLPSLILLNEMGLAIKTNIVEFVNNYTVTASIRADSNGRFLVTGPYAKIDGQPHFRYAWINPDGSTQITPVVVVKSVTRNAGITTLTITSLSAGTFKLQASQDLRTWNDLKSLSITEGDQTITAGDPAETAFYRIAK